MREGSKTALNWLAAGIDALAHADAVRLEELAATAGQVSGPVTEEEKRWARQQRRALEQLLTLTQRNLLLLGGSRAARYGSLAE